MIRRYSNDAPRRVEPSRTGAVLLEAMVAMAILGLTGIAWMVLLVQSLHSVDQARHREAALRVAAAALNATSVWSPADLAAHVGTSRFHGVDLEVGELTPTLFSLTALDTLTGTALLRTSVYATNRADSTR